MKSTIEALQDIYISLGGLLTDTYDNINNGSPVGDYATIPDIAEAISKKATAGEGLPDVTSADNGDILSVVNGAWDKAALPKELPTVSPSNSGEALTVNSSGKWAVGKIGNNGLAPSFELCSIDTKAGIGTIGPVNALFMAPTGMLKFAGKGGITASDLNLSTPKDILEITLPTDADLSNTNETIGCAPIWDSAGSGCGAVKYVLNRTSRKVTVTLFIDSKSASWSGTFNIGAMQL
jgi:hypothetical protein